MTVTEEAQVLMDRLNPDEIRIASGVRYAVPLLAAAVMVA